MEQELNLLPFVIEAIAQKKKIWSDIDDLYQTNKYEFYNAAKESEWYNHSILTEGDIYRQEYGRKALGIMIYSTESPEISKQLFDILIKGYNKEYMYANNYEPVSLKEFVDKYFKPSTNDNSILDLELNAIATMLAFFAWNLDKTMDQETTEMVVSILQTRLKHYEPDSPIRINYDTLDRKLLKEAKSLKERVYNKHVVKNFDDLNVVRNSRDADIATWTIGLDFLYDFEDLSAPVLFDNIEFTQQDIEEILATYYYACQNRNTYNALKFLISSIHIKYLLKAYKQLKDHYFENNRETMYIELQGLEAEIAKLKKENQEFRSIVISQKTQIGELKLKLDQEYNRAKDTFLQEIRQLQEENQDLHNELQDWHSYKNELDALRELAFSLEQTYVHEQHKIDTDQINSSSIAIIGGHPAWQNQIKDRLPNARVISADALNVDPTRWSGVDLIVFNTAYLGHSMYFKIIEYARKYNVSVGYIANQNIEMSLSQIAHWYSQK